MHINVIFQLLTENVRIFWREKKKIIRFWNIKYFAKYFWLNNHCSKYFVQFNFFFFFSIIFRKGKKKVISMIMWCRIALKMSPSENQAKENGISSFSLMNRLSLTQWSEYRTSIWNASCLNFMKDENWNPFVNTK